MHFAGKKRQCLQLYALSKRVKWMMITLLVPPDLTVRGNRTFGKRASSICPPPPLAQSLRGVQVEVERNDMYWYL